MSIKQAYLQAGMGLLGQKVTLRQKVTLMLFSSESEKPLLREPFPGQKVTKRVRK